MISIITLYHYTISTYYFYWIQWRNNILMKWWNDVSVGDFLSHWPMFRMIGRRYKSFGGWFHIAVGLETEIGQFRRRRKLSVAGMRSRCRGRCWWVVSGRQMDPPVHHSHWWLWFLPVDSLHFRDKSQKKTCLVVRVLVCWSTVIFDSLVRVWASTGTTFLRTIDGGPTSCLVFNYNQIML